MKPVRKIRIEISHIILGISAVLWMLFLFNPRGNLTMHHCPVADAGPSSTSLQMLLAMNPIGLMLTGWTLMVIAMMLPKLILPIRYIYKRSLKRRRFRSALLFLSGYVGVWMAAGFFMLVVIFGLTLLMPRSLFPVVGVGVIALAWQFSPFKQQCLNRGHDHWTLSVFGWTADRDALLFGVSHGAWCVGSGWLMMLFPMLLPAGHVGAMFFVTFIMISEHMEHPQPPRWRIDFRTKLLRIAVAQMQIRLRQKMNLN